MEKVKEKQHNKYKNFPKPKSERLVYEYDLINSIAYRELTKNEMLMLHAFYLKRKLLHVKGKKGRSDSWEVLNNGEITFTYSEALKYGWGSKTFTRGLDKFIQVGFIDMAKQGLGISESSLFSISKRWEKYGTEEFEKMERPKLKNQIIGLKERFKSKKSTVKNV